ncbi:MAG: choice-of-anchor D domain-containing protein [Prevotella sp.]|nr:choice-of-anchor D domain-containing protein [Prevotella sp.]
MRKINLLFLLMLSLMGITQLRAQETLTVYDGTTTNQYVPMYGYYADVQGTLSEFVIPAADLAGIDGATITALKFYSSNASVAFGAAQFKVYLKEVADGALNTAFSGDADATTVYTGSLSISSNEMDIQFSNEYSYGGGNLLVGIYTSVKGTYNKANFYGTGGFDNICGRYRNSSNGNGSAQYFIPKTTLSYEAAADGPGFKVVGYKTGDNVSFGLVEPSATKTITLQNPGTEEVTVNISTTGAFTASETTVTIPGNKGEQTVTFTAPAELGAATGTVTFTPTAAGLEPVTLNISCTVRDPEKMFEDFSGNALPEGWTTKGIGSYTTGSSASSYVWDFSKGYAWYKNSGSTVGMLDNYKHSLMTPLMEFDAAGEKMYFKVKKEPQYSSYYSTLVVQYSENGTTWIDTQEGTFADAALTTDFKDAEVTIPGTAKYVRFVGVGIALDDIYGGKLSTVPVMEVVAKDYNFGMVDAEAETTFKIKNTGKSPLTDIQVTSDNASFTVANVPESIEAGAEADVTVKMLADAAGTKSGVITVEAPSQATVTFNVSGYVMDNTLFTETFDANELPAGWEMESGGTYKWTFTDGYAYATSSNACLITPDLTVAEGEKMAIEVKKYNTWSCTLPIYVSKDGGEFTLLKTIANADLSTDEYRIFYIEGLEAGSYRIRFDGNGIQMNAVNGFHLNMNAPKMEVTPDEKAAFGKVTANAEKTYTVANVGTGELTVNIASDNEEFTVSPAQLVITDEAKTFTVTYNYTEGNYGAKTANITVTPTYNEAAAKTIVATAKAMDPNAWDVDFEEGTFATGWDAANWTIGTKSYADSQIAYGTAKDAVLVTPRLEAKANDVLMIETYFDWNDEGLKIEYSTDDKATWQVATFDGITLGKPSSAATSDYIVPQNNGITANRDAMIPVNFVAPADGYYYLRFTTSYSGNGIDNLNGFKLAMKEHEAVISEVNIRSTFNQFTNHTVSVTVKEMAGKEEVLTAKFFIGDTQYGDDAVETVEAGGTKEFVVNVTLDDIISGDAYFVVYNDEINLESEKVAITVKPAVILDENEATELGTGYQDKVALRYTAKKGWNTICVPFALTDTDLEAIFGEGYKVYELKGYTNGELKFNVADRRYAGYPYIVYSENPVTLDERGYLLTYVSFSTVKYDSYGNAKFQGTFEPIPAPGMEGKYGVVPSTGHIKVGGPNASLKGYRAYFELPEGTEASGISLDFGDGTVITGIEAVELLNGTADVYDLNGRKMDNSNLQRGVYVINGKKVVIK